MLRPIALATLIGGTLDIAFAMILTLLYGLQIDAMLRYVASGPFPSAIEMGAAGAILGLVVHFALMAAMATIFMVLIRLRPQLVRALYVAGVAYGILTYFAMNWVAVPLRFETPLPSSPLAIATQLFAHVTLLGIPFAFVAARYRGVLIRPEESTYSDAASHVETI